VDALQVLPLHDQDQIGSAEDLRCDLASPMCATVQPLLDKQFLCRRIDFVIDQSAQASRTDLDTPAGQRVAHHDFRRRTTTDVADTDEQNILEH